MDPWFTRELTQAVSLGDGDTLVLRLLRGELTVYDGSRNQFIGLAPEEEKELLAVFPDNARQPPVQPDIWTRKEVLHDTEPERRYGDCPVPSENHLEKTMVPAFQRSTAVPKGRILNLGGIYGGRHGADPDVPDDPVVELVRALPDAKVLCWACEDPAAVTRLGSLASHFDNWAVPDLLAEDLTVPKAFRELDMLRMDALPMGRSCSVLSRLLRSGVRPTFVSMLVLSQVPPPIKLAPLARDVARHPPALMSCSLAAAAEVVAPYGLALVHLTGPYALFVDKGSWPEPLPLNMLDCYRRADVWGHSDFPIEFVRDWLFSPVEEATRMVWGNVSRLYERVGQPGAPFSIGW